MNKHTPGPWTICEHSWSDTGIYADGRQIALLNIEPYATEENQSDLEKIASANAQLIAASPDLLFALQRFLKVFGGEEWSDMQTCKMAEAAIAKATGSQP